MNELLLIHLVLLLCNVVTLILQWCRAREGVTVPLLAEASRRDDYKTISTNV